MINGFLLEIENATLEEQLIPFFKKEQLPEGVYIRAKGTSYDYDSLLLLATSKGFKGTGIMVDDINVNRLSIYKNNEPKDIILNKIIDDIEILIDGGSNYITLVIPPRTNVLIQLIQDLN